MEEKAGESLFWLELVVEANLMPAARVEDLIQEADELTAIFVASRKRFANCDFGFPNDYGQSPIVNPKEYVMTDRQSQIGNRQL